MTAPVQATWTELLDELERGADACERHFLEGSDEPPTLLAVPQDIGPLPEELGARARAVLQRIDGVNARLARVRRPAPDAGRTHFAGASSSRPTRFDRAI